MWIKIPIPGQLVALWRANQISKPSDWPHNTAGKKRVFVYPKGVDPRATWDKQKKKRPKSNRANAPKRPRRGRGRPRNTDAPPTTQGSVYPYVSPDTQQYLDDDLIEIEDSARDATEWLAYMWPKKAAEDGIEQFKFERYDEIIRGEFPTPYWLPCTPQGEAQPTANPIQGIQTLNPNPQFRIPGNANTRTAYSPIGDFTGTPGTAGATAGGAFQDQYWSWHMFLFDLPQPIRPAYLQPMMGTATAIFTTSNSHQRIRTQTNLLMRSTVGAPDGAGMTPSEPLDATLNYYRQQREGDTREFIYDAWRNYRAPSGDPAGATRVNIEFGAAPSMGKYHHTNTSMTCTTEITCDLYQAQPETPAANLWSPPLIRQFWPILSQVCESKWGSYYDEPLLIKNCANRMRETTDLPPGYLLQYAHYYLGTVTAPTVAAVNPDNGRTFSNPHNFEQVAAEKWATGRESKNILHQFICGDVDPDLGGQFKATFYFDGKGNYIRVNDDFDPHWQWGDYTEPGDPADYYPDRFA